ncbi:hypothetical protein DERF_010467 [Dermatophagoides farinae]|uniref:Uncharacterized protein n=1 Tax=Dermatophagoides farinae TaxID=6954 RepID=A0A922HYH0_DERFA|nr:hypothetical protein DERF_010467 [Dermatophagoides farinae]
MNFFHFLADSFVILHEQQYSVVDCCSIRTRSIHCSRYYYYYSCHFGIQLNQISSSSSNSVLDPSLVKSIGLIFWVSQFWDTGNLSVSNGLKHLQ